MPPNARSHPSSDKFRRTVPIADSRRAAVVDRLSQIVRTADLFDQNEDEMVLPNPVMVRLTAHHPGGGSARFMVFSRHFCPEGMWFMHTGFLHPGSRCVLVLPRGDDQEGGVIGSVETCELIERNLHAISLRFDSVIDPEVFRSLTRTNSGVGATESVALPTLRARVLLLDNCPIDREVVSFHLRSLGARFSCYERLADALADLQSEGFDVVVTELNLEEGPGEQAIQAIRSAGYTGPVVVLTAEEDADRLRSARQDGAFAVLQKPFEPAHLIRTLSAAVKQQAPKLPAMRAAAPPALSEEMAPLFGACARRLEGLCRDLIAAGRSDDIAEAKSVLTLLGGSPEVVPACDTREIIRGLESVSTLVDQLVRLGASGSSDAADAKA